MPKKFESKNDIEDEMLWSLQVHEGMTREEAIQEIIRQRDGHRCVSLNRRK
jgi:hypothetical protein